MGERLLEHGWMELGRGDPLGQAGDCSWRRSGVPLSTGLLNPVENQRSRELIHVRWRRGECVSRRRRRKIGTHTQQDWRSRYHFSSGMSELRNLGQVTFLHWAPFFPCNIKRNPTVCLKLLIPGPAFHRLWFKGVTWSPFHKSQLDLERGPARL